MTASAATTTEPHTNTPKDLTTNLVTELESYDSCKLWLEGYNSASTRRAYKIHLSFFCKYHNVNPDSLIQLKPEQIKNMILIYIIHLKKVAKQTVGKARSGEISVNSIKVYLTGVQSFLESNEIILNWKKIAKYYPEQVSNILRSYTKEEIATLLSIAADLRDPEEKYQATQNLDRIYKDLRDSGISF